MAKDDVKTARVSKPPILGGLFNMRDTYKTSNGSKSGFGSTPEKSQKDFERKSK
jgi:hypothetical protein